MPPRHKTIRNVFTLVDIVVHSMVFIVSLQLSITSEYIHPDTMLSCCMSIIQYTRWSCLTFASNSLVISEATFVQNTDKTGNAMLNPFCKTDIPY